MTIDVSTFYGQSDFPITDKKQSAIANLLPLLHKFLKFEYLLKNKAIIKVKTSVFYEYFVSYCMTTGLKAHGRNDFFDKLTEISINRVKTNGENYYNVSTEQLQQLSKKYKWICKYDDDDMSENNVENKDDCIDYKQKYFELLALHEESNKDDVSVLTESTVTTEISIDSIVEDKFAIYRETYKEQYDKLEKITKNIRIINKKIKNFEETDDLYELIEQQALIEKLAKNKKKYDNIMNSFSEPVKQVVEQSFPL